jgi:hypothetical protein
MLNKNLLLLLVLVFQSLLSIAQNMGIIKGRIYDPISNEPVPFANVVLQNTTIGATSDENGNYEIGNLKPGLYNLQCSFVGYKPYTTFEIQVSNARAAIIDIPLSPNAETLKEVVIQAKPFARTEESPLSLRNIGVNEIKRNPGGNRDISRAIQSLPGVATTGSFRNDILIRGGAPSENRFFIDGIEIPTINHFATQGSSGGPVGIINVDFVNEVDFYSGAFPATRGNSLSSVFDFKFKEGNPDRLTFNGIVGATDIGATLDGPIGKKTNFIFSARRSYLQFLFAALQLPILPTYNDFQFKVKHKINDKNSITFLGIGAIDNFKLNTKIGTEAKTAEDSLSVEANKLLLENLPINNQWNYTIGAKYTNFRKNSYTNVVLSRSHLNNRAYKYRNNIENGELLFDYVSEEIENKLRVEDIVRYKNDFKLTYGASLDLVTYTNSTFQKVPVADSIFIVDYTNKLNLVKYGVFAQLSKSFFNNKLATSVGIRTDANSYSKEMGNPLEQISPRLSLSYAVSPILSVNFNTGMYYQLPAYTILGYTEGNELVNKNNGVRYTGCNHIVGGIEINTKRNNRITIEGYYKQYSNYPFSIQKGISLANLGADFGVIGNEQINSTSEGRTYGMEVLVQQKLFKGFYGIASYTLGWSQFKETNGEYAPSAWDARHIISLTGGKKLGKNWELGARFRFSSGLPFTPFDRETTALIPIWNANNTGIPDYSRLNDERGQPFHGLDFRIDKKWFFKRWNLNLFLDVQNAYAFKSQGQPVLNTVRDVAGNPIVNPADPTRYLLKDLPNENGTLIPSIGIIVEL